MRKRLELLLLSVLIPISCTSQSIYPQKLNDSLVVITASQLKQTNQIFAEHHELKLLKSEYEKQINSYIKLNESFERSDSLQTSLIHELYTDDLEKRNTITKLNKKVNTYKSLSIGGVVVGIIGFLIGILK